MKYTLVFSELASEDLTEILGYYKEQDVSGLNKRFIESISHTLKRIEVNPELYPFAYKSIRRALLKTFPYKILYYIDEVLTEVHIIGVIHQSRDPKIWRNRL
jgi:plasmid stabilization system protein ParE